MTINIYLDAHVLPEGHGVWKCFPGKTYRFYETVNSARVVFLDVRGLDLLAPDPRDWSDAEILQTIAADRWSREQARADLGAVPKGSDAVSSLDRRNMTFLKGLLLTAKKGDLIVIPPDNYRKSVLIGELLDHPGEVVSHTAVDGEIERNYVGRRVKWLAKKEKRSFSSDLIDLLHTPAAFFALPRRLHEEIYRVSYENFIVGDVFSATFETSKEHFSTSDNAVVSVWFNALAAVRDHLEGRSHIGSNDNFYAIGLLRSLSPAEGELGININSPGEYVLRSLGVFAFVAMAFFPITSVEANDILAQPIRVHVKTVGTAGDECALRVAEALKNYAEVLSLLRLRDACVVGERAKSEATLTTKARAVVGPEVAER